MLTENPVLLYNLRKQRLKISKFTGSIVEKEMGEMLFQLVIKEEIQRSTLEAIHLKVK